MVIWKIILLTKKRPGLYTNRNIASIFLRSHQIIMSLLRWHQFTASGTAALRSYSILTPWSRVLLEKLTDLQLVNKFLAFYGTRRFITALTSARHLSISWASSDYFVTRGSISHMCFVTKVFLRRGIIIISPNPKTEGPPRVGRPRLLIQYIRSYPPN
jgi:hypothetical protein